MIKTIRFPRLALLVAMALLALGPAVLVCMPGCTAAQHAQAQASKSLLIVGETVHAAMNAYGELYRAGKVPSDTAQRIDGLHARYRALYAVAVAAVGTDLSQPSPLELSLLAAQLVTAVEGLRQ